MEPSNESQSAQPSSAPFAHQEVEDTGTREDDILSVSWNQDNGCFATGRSSGFRIYNCDPLKETIRRNLNGGGFALVEMLFRTNILALVGSASNKQYPPNKLMIWDDFQSRFSGEFVFRSHVRAVKLRQDIIVVVLEFKIYVYTFPDRKLIHQIETLSNPRGICSISYNSTVPILACPGSQKGQIHVEQFGHKATKIAAHESDIACLTLTSDGLFLATASVKGTLIRIFDPMNGNLLQEVRRGTERAEINSISFSPTVQWLAVSSDKGTIHVFCLRVQVSQDDGEKASVQDRDASPQKSSVPIETASSSNAKPTASRSLVRGVLPKYFSSERSFAQFHLPDVTGYMATFGSRNTVMILGRNGSFYRCSFDTEKGGEMTQQEHIRFLEPEKR